MRLLLLFLAICSLDAAYIGNPASPGIMNNGFFTSTNPFFKFTTGYYGDYVSDMRFVETKTSPGFETNGFKEFGLHSQMATGSFILLERIEFLAGVGGSKEHAKISKTPTMSEVSDVLLDFQSTYHFSWNVGTRIILLEWSKVYLSTTFNYFQVPSSSKSYFRFLNRLNLPLETEKQEFAIDEWQGTLGLSLRIFFLTPYGGLSYIHSKLNIQSGADVPPLYYKNKESLGYFYGLTLSLTGRFHLNFERRVRDEFAYSFSTIAVF